MEGGLSVPHERGRLGERLQPGGARPGERRVFVRPVPASGYPPEPGVSAVFLPGGGMTLPQPNRSLGWHGPAVFPIALGCMGMSGMYGPADEAESLATIHAAIDRGVNLIDTGDFMAWATMKCSSGARWRAGAMTYCSR